MLDSNLYIDIHEVTNHHYREYLFWLDSCQPEKMYTMLPDTMVWKTLDTKDSLLYKYYFRHPYYEYFPVVGVSFEQAIAYCEWRAKMLNNFIHLKITESYPGLCDVNKAPSYVSCRLPNKEEWLRAATNKLDSGTYSYRQVKLYNRKGKPLTNTIERFYYDQSHVKYYNHESPIPYPVESGEKNDFGLYNLIGNVSELIEGNKVIGLNYLTKQNGIPIYNSPYSPASTLEYSEPKSWIGFRCIIIVNRENWP